jgi:molecular chaperone GrpE (heat shock protein)
MSDDNNPIETIPLQPPPRGVSPSTTRRLIEEMIALRESTGRQLKFFEQTVLKLREESQAGFNSFVGETTRAYQSMRQELHGEKRLALALQSQLLEVALDLTRIVSARPGGDDLKSMQAWGESVAVLSRKVDAMLVRLGIQPYHAVIGSPYNPALHERVGNRPVEGMGPLLVAEEMEPGWASQQPEFVLLRPKVFVTE